MTEGEAAIVRVWEFTRNQIIEEIEALSSAWRPNGPAVAVAERISKHIRNIPTPVPKAEASL